MRLTLHLILLFSAAWLCGCSAFPDIAHQPQIHNPYPQLSRIAVLPFFNQSAEPTVDGEAVAVAYYNELQVVRGFEVLPVGVAKQVLLGSGMRPQSGAEFQQLARLMDVDAVVVGSVTEYSPYYPPRFGLAVRWYAANPGFHPIPPGYGLPWGTSEEEFIPSSLVFDAEFALAKEQLATQTPATVGETIAPDTERSIMPADRESAADPTELVVSPETTPPPGSTLIEGNSAEREGELLVEPELLVPPPALADLGAGGAGLPPEWPDPRGFVPPPPSEVRPESIPQTEPVLSLTRLYHGNDAEFTRRLANYFYFRDDGRFGDWQAYLQRSEDFIRFCCHLHISELLAARGGAGKTRVVWRWPIDRYQR